MPMELTLAKGGYEPDFVALAPAIPEIGKTTIENEIDKLMIDNENELTIEENESWTKIYEHLL